MTVGACNLYLFLLSVCTASKLGLISVCHVSEDSWEQRSGALFPPIKSPTGPRFLLDSHHALLLDATTSSFPCYLRQTERRQRQRLCVVPKRRVLVPSAGTQTPCEDFTHWLKGGERVSLKTT